MPSQDQPAPVNAVLSLDPLLSFWRREMAPKCTHMAAMFEVFETQLKQSNGYGDGNYDETFLLENPEVLIPLMSVIFPAASWHTDIAAALTPFRHRPFYYTPTFKQLFLSEDGSVKGYFEMDQENSVEHRRILQACWLVLEKVYGIRQKQLTGMVYRAPDPHTGLDRFYRIEPDWRFVEVVPAAPPKKLSDDERDTLIDRIADLNTLQQLISLRDFELRGFSLIRAMDVTESEVVLALEKNLIDQESIFSLDGFTRLQTQLRTLFGRPDLRAGMGALREEQVWVINDGGQSTVNCLFRNSSQIPLKDLTGSVWMKAVDQAETITIRDLREKPDPCQVEKDALNAGVRSMIIAPLYFKGRIIGTFQIISPRPSDLGAMDKQLVEQIAPLFSVALKRGLDDMNNEVQSIIKEKCTVVHPSVEWRFQKAALSHMTRLRAGKPSEMEPIVFKKVIPLYGQSDIRGSSQARGSSIQADLSEQLRLAKDVLTRAADVRSWPIVKALLYNIEKRGEALQKGWVPEAETSIIAFLQDEVEPTFDELIGLGPKVNRAVEAYRRALDPELGFVYRKRKAFEQSMSVLNKRLSRCLDREEAIAQKDFPHYFEKHQTDGIDYVIYIGQSLMENGTFTAFHHKNMLLWQFMVACGMARQTLAVKSELEVPLDSCHLILYHSTPLSIRFRYDEKRFDVDGAYDVRHEIIKSRLDKAHLKGGAERLTQPGRIAVVYSHPHEGRQLHEHVEFLQSKEYLSNDLETVDIEELSGVGGLKALRVSVNLEAAPRAGRLEQEAG